MSDVHGSQACIPFELVPSEVVFLVLWMQAGWASSLGGPCLV